jgi:hypothetical protein
MLTTAQESIRTEASDDDGLSVDISTTTEVIGLSIGDLNCLLDPSQVPDLKKLDFQLRDCLNDENKFCMCMAVRDRRCTAGGEQLLWHQSIRSLL